MDYKELIKRRHSTREYKHSGIGSGKIGLIKDYFKDTKRLIEDIDVEMTLYEDGDKVFERLNGIAGYHGFMPKAPHYIIFISDEKEGCLENTGYIGEQIILKATEQEVETCWITFSDSEKIKTVLNIETEKVIAGIIAMGHGEHEKVIINPLKTGGNYSKANIKIIDNSFSARFSPEEIVYMKEWGVKVTVEELENRGMLEAFTYARLAPSLLNQQPWKFILDDTILILTILDDGTVAKEDEKIDAGIIMLYFDLMIKETLIEIKWNMGSVNGKYNVPDEYKMVSWCSL